MAKWYQVEASPRRAQVVAPRSSGSDAAVGIQDSLASDSHGGPVPRRRIAELALERAIESGLRFVAYLRGYLGDAVVSGGQHVGALVQPPARQIGDRRLPHILAEAIR